MGAIRIKICGVTRVEDAVRAAELGADAVGLNFYPASPRCLDAPRAEAILRALPPFVEPVALFVNQPLRDVFVAMNTLPGVRTIQWHGEQPELCDAFPFRLIPAFSIRDRASLLTIARYLDLAKALNRAPAAVLVDAHVPGQFGGTGQTAPWDLLADFRPDVPYILAGGLTPENVAEAIRIVRPYAVDVASGVESAPGIKDAEKMRRFIESARAACI